MNRMVHTSRSHTGRRGGAHSHRLSTLRLFRVRWGESCLEFAFHSLRTAFPVTRGRVKLMADCLDPDVCGFV